MLFLKLFIAFVIQAGLVHLSLLPRLENNIFAMGILGYKLIFLYEQYNNLSTP